MHIDGLCHQLSTSLFALRRISSIQATEVAYLALFESRARHGNMLWGGILKLQPPVSYCPTEKSSKNDSKSCTAGKCRDVYDNHLDTLTITSLYILILYAVAAIYCNCFSKLSYNLKFKSCTLIVIIFSSRFMARFMNYCFFSHQ